MARKFYKLLIIGNPQPTILHIPNMNKGQDSVLSPSGFLTQPYITPPALEASHQKLSLLVFTGASEGADAGPPRRRLSRR